MPPKRKKLGRPPGSKNKKTIKNDANKKVKKAAENQLKYDCSICGQRYPSQKALNKHKALELSQVIYTKSAFSCKECPKKFRFEKSYKEHILKEHSKAPDSIACDKCSVRCPDQDTLAEHTQKFHERDIYLCPHCEKEFVRQSHVLRHLAQSGCDGKAVNTYSCEICFAKFSRKDNLAVHIRLQHIYRRDYYCKYCSFSTKNFSKLVNHWHQKHSETPLQYQCNDCGKWISSRAAMTKHLEIHGDKKYACDVCGYNTHTVEVMRRHVLTHVEEKPHKCNICDKSYIQRSQLQRHLQQHAGNICNKCEKPFSSRAKLLMHMRDHMGLEKLFCPFKTCPYAQKEFINEASLTNHLTNLHLEQKQHSCEVCDKKFHSEINLKRHLETHTLDRPRRCMYCVSARAYVRGEQLIRHVRKHHPAVFRGHLHHVRQVLGTSESSDRVKKSELESILNLLDVESDRILQGYGGAGVLYGGMQEEGELVSVPVGHSPDKKPNNPLMSEDDLAENLSKLIAQLIDKETLSLLGWPDESVDVVLEKVIEQCGARPADRVKWTRVQRLRENTKHLFLYVIEDKNIARMLDTHTIDQIVTHILKQVSEDETAVEDL